MYFNRHNNRMPGVRTSFANDYPREYPFHSYCAPSQSNLFPQNSTQQRRESFHHQNDRPGSFKRDNHGHNHKEKNNFTQKSNPPNVNHDDYKSYICPGCFLHFDCLSRNNRYTGRVPLILNCSHTLCQECIYKKAISDNITCPICKETSELANKSIADNLQEVFPPNYYLFGLIIWTKPHGNNFKQPMLVPTQVMLSNRKVSGSQPVVHVPTPNTGETCCFLSCNKMAVLRCQDCNDVYCVDCCTVVHKSAKSLLYHVQVHITNDVFSVELAKCPYHSMDVEFFCRTCKTGACCYCFLENHEGHERDCLSKLNDVELKEFRKYKEKSERIYKQLIISQKKLKSMSSNNSSEVEGKICSYFADLHARFYAIQKKLQKQATNLEDVGRPDDGLVSLRSSLDKSIDTMKNLIISAENVDQKKINLRGLLLRLREVQNMPCYLLTEAGGAVSGVEFETAAILQNPEELFKLKRMDDSRYTLVGEDRLPPGFVVEPGDDSGDESVISSLRSSSKKNESIPANIKITTPSTFLSATNKFPQKRKKINGKQPINQQMQIPSENEMVEVTHIESLECFYVQLKKLQSRFMQMNKDIDNFVKMGASTVDQPQINELYLAMYVMKNEKMWCRGRVTNIKQGIPKPVYEVFFLDYGSTQTLTIDKLREITPHLAQRKPFAIQCELYNPTYANWGKNAHVYMGKMINGKEVFMMVKDITNGIYQVDLMVSSSDKGLTSIIDILIHTCSNALSTSSDGSSVASQGKETFTPEHKIFNNSIEFQKGQSENVFLANIIDPHHIFVHMAAYMDALKKMNSEMKYHYKNVPYNSCIPIEGTYVVVEHRDPIRGAWHRAMVKKVDMNLTKVHVLLVDWGNTVVVPWSSIRLLNDSFTRLESQAILVKLADVEPYQQSESWSEKATFFLQKNFRTQETLKMTVRDVDPLEVALFENAGAADICINAQLVQAKLADSTGKLSQTVVWPQNDENQPEFAEDEGFVAALLKKVHENLEDSDEDAEVSSLVKQPVTVVKVVNPHQIHIKFAQLEHQELTLHKELQICYVKERETRDAWQEGEDCVVVFADAYVRGKILERLDDDKYKVNVYDKATETVLPKEKIFAYSDYFRKYPNVVFKSHLANVKPAGGDRWSLTSIEALEKIFDKHKDVYATKVPGDVSRKSIPMLMWYAQVEVVGALEPSVTRFVSINNLLVKMGFAYKWPEGAGSAVGEGDGKEACPSEGKVELTVSAMVHATDDKSDRSLDDSADEKRAELDVEGEETDTGSETKEKSALDDSSKETSKGCTSSTDWNVLIEEETAAAQQREDSSNATDVAEIEEWTPAFRIGKREFNAWITCAYPDGTLYLRDEDLQPVYKDMEANMKQYFDKQPPIRDETEWRAGKICTITQEGYWYRGTILKVNGPDDIDALMIDFGSEHPLTAKQLYRKILYPEIPAFASKVRLNKVFAKTGEWMDSDYQTLMARITEYAKIVIVGPLDVDVPLAEIQLSTGENLNQLLCNLCPNLTRCLKSPVCNPEEDSVVIEKEEPLVGTSSDLDQDVHTSTDEADADAALTDEAEADAPLADKADIDEPLTDFEFEPLPITSSEKMAPMTIVEILSYDKVVITHPGDPTEALYDLSLKINDGYATQPVLGDIKAGMPCICPYALDGLWYRARVHNVEGLDCGYVFVFFVDFGNVESVSTKDIRAMRPDWLYLPVRCFIASLDVDLKTENHVKHVFQHMQKLDKKTKLVKIVREDPLTINLYEENGELCYQSLVNTGLLRIK